MLKIRYSSLIHISLLKNSILLIKGPLGKSTLKLPSCIRVYISKKYNFIYIYSKKKSYILNFISIFYSRCRSIVFGDLVSLELKGLGLKFLDKSKKNSNYVLSMNLGFSNIIYHKININRSIFFIKNTRKILIYGISFSYLRNICFKIISFKKPDNYKKKGFTFLNIII